MTQCIGASLTLGPRHSGSDHIWPVAQRWNMALPFTQHRRGCVCLTDRGIGSGTIYVRPIFKAARVSTWSDGSGPRNACVAGNLNSNGALLYFC